MCSDDEEAEVCSKSNETPFTDAEEAWFWYARCQRARNEGVRFKDRLAKESRPCDPDDIYRYVMTMVRARSIGQEHLRVMAFYGLAERVPDGRARDEERPARLWDEAMDFLGGMLRVKGIVE